MKKATGRGWAQWLALLDRAGAGSWPHRDIAAYLARERGVPDWWSQMVAVGYERARGLRAKHQKGEHFEISGSRTIAVPVAALFRAWADHEHRARWLPARLEVRRATRAKSMRITWEPDRGRTSVSVNFYPIGPARSRVSLNHGKLPSAAAGERMKKYWADRLSDLKEMLEA